MYELVIKGGRVALDDDWADCDIGIENGRIAELNTSLVGRRVIDASQRWVMPGGIDSHCHLDQPAWGSALSADDFLSGSVSAAFGGTTCIIPFAMPGPGMSTLEAYDRAIARAAGRSVIDYGLHGVITMTSASKLEEQFAHLVREGVTSVKVFMIFEELRVDDDLFLGVLETARKLGLVVMVHAENDAAIRRTSQRLIDLGRTDMRYHTVAHSEVMEREATHRAVALAEIAGARLIVLHVSCLQSAEEITRGQQRGVDVGGETCPQYLFLSAADLDQEAAKAARFIFSPPARTPTSQEYLWRALASGEIDLWSSDHSPYRLSDKLPDPGNPAFHKAVSGIPGLETRLPLLFSEGLLTKRLSLVRYLDLTSREAASLYGLSHTKGRIRVGLDADLALWDPTAKWVLHHDILHSNVDYTPFEGRLVTGKPTTVLLRGAPIIVDEKLTALPGTGNFVQRRAADPIHFKRPIEEMTPWFDK